MTNDTHTWKYQLGDLVVPVMQNGYEQSNKMLVISRLTEEFSSHVERSYTCSHFKLGDCIRQRFMESELAPWKAKV